MGLSTLLLLFVSLVEVFSWDQCKNNNASQCLCLLAEDYEYQCPTFVNNVLIRTLPDEYLNIDCYDLETLDLGLFPNYICGNASVVRMKFCPLPEDNFVTLFKKLGVKNVEEFNLDNVTVTGESFTKNVFFGLGDLKVLILSHLDYALNDDVFDFITKLSQLYLENSGIERLDNLRLPSSLEILHITGNLLEEVPREIFRNLTRLKQLHLWRNRISAVRRNDFVGLSELKSLELSFNKIASIEEGSFDELSKLDRINLGGNKIEKIDSNLFKNNKNLTSIRMENNPNLILPDGIFSNLDKLTRINIKNSGIEIVPENIFENSTNLKEIKMEKNRIKVIPNGLFKKLLKLEKLDLSYNRIDSLLNDTFSDLTNLQDLNLNYNNITYISRDLFRNTKELLGLSIRNNKIFDIDIEAFLGLKKLTTLDLSNNVYEGNYLEGASPFARCVALKNIILTNNSIQKFPNVLLGMRNIEKIDLNYNKIRDIEILEITSTPASNLQTIDLSNNEIQHVDFYGVEVQTGMNLKELDAYHNTFDQIVLNLKNNPLACDCGNYDLVRYMQNDMIPGVKTRVDIVVQGTECVEPDWYKNFKIENLKPRDIFCQIMIVPCPKECECYWRPYMDFIEVECANRNLTRFPKLKMTNKNVSINLNGNRISEELRSDSGYENVKTLTLSNNKIRELKWIPMGLEVLNLYGNELTRFSSEFLQKMDKMVHLKSIRLSNNPWDCECSALDFQIFIKDHYKKVNSTDVVCKKDRTLLIEKTELCRPSVTLILLTVLPVLFILLSLVVGLILYIRFRQELKVWLFSRNLCLRFVTEEEMDEDKIYDVFISYSNKDEDFVMQNLRPALESGPRPFKTCIHIRDWTPGELIWTNVVNSIKNSKRTLIVLSNNFLDSAWGVQEFKTAHTQAVEEGRARVVVVKYGDLDENRLDEDIKSYLNTNTYVEWGKPWFWNKLKYALPHSQQKGFYKTNQKHVDLISNIDDKFELKKPIKQSETTPPVILNPALLNDHLLNFCNANDIHITSSETPLVATA